MGLLTLMPGNRANLVFHSPDNLNIYCAGQVDLSFAVVGSSQTFFSFPPVSA